MGKVSYRSPASGRFVTTKQNASAPRTTVRDGAVSASTPPRVADTGRFVIGRAAIDRILAIEGLYRDEASERMFRDFDARGLSDAERRAAIRAAYGAATSKPSRRTPRKAG